MNSTLDDRKISARDMFYFRQRQKNKLFQSVLAYFVKCAEREGLTKKELACRLNKDPAQITRWFSEPNNWTLDTISDLLLGMDAEMKYEIVSLGDRTQESDVLFFHDWDQSSTSDSSNTGSTEYHDTIEVVNYA